MKRFLWITLCLCVTLAALAQKQQGIVRTIERPGQKSVGISGVTIKINEYPNAIVSGKGGRFSFSLQGKKQGDQCLVTRVDKKGYTLIDKMPSFAYSFSTPAEIVMVSNKQLQQDERRIREDAEKKAAATYERRLAELERQLQEKTISEESYREQLQQVFDGHENFLKMIDEMARRYAMTDYKGISEINRQIQECIENAELERADSLINSKGDLNQRKKELEEKRDVKQKIDSLSLALQEEINFGINELANDFFSKHLICASRYDNDSAAYYLIERVKLDTTNVDWLIEAGGFIERYLADYSLALEYYQRGLSESLSQYGEKSEQTATLYNNIGCVYQKLADYGKALELLKKALSIREYLYGSNHLAVANSYNNIGNAYSNQADFTQAIECLLKGLAIKKRLLGDNHSDLAVVYNNLGSAYISAGDFSQALENYNIALTISLNESDNAVSYNNMGDLYEELGDFPNALHYYQLALAIQERIYGINHPDVATTLSNLGTVYSKLCDFTHAFDYYQKAISIREHLFAPGHPVLAESYLNFGALHTKKGDFSLALDNYQKAISIYENSGLEANNLNIAIAYSCVGVVYEKTGDLAQALEHYRKSLLIFEQRIGTNNQYVADLYNNLGSLYYRQNNFIRAKDYFEKSLRIKELIYDQDNVDLAISYNNIGTIYEAQKDYSRALNYYQKALFINEKIYGVNHIEVATSFNNIGVLLYRQGDYNGALEYYQKSLEIREHLLDSNALELAQSYNNIGHVYSSIGDYSKALPYYRKSWSICEKKLGVDAPKTRLDRWDYYSCLYNNALKNGNLNDFLLNHCFTAQVADGETVAKQQGMSGEYVLLEHTKWCERSAFSFIEYVKNIGNNPKDLVVLKDGTITKHHFENKIGVIFEIKQITIEEREEINRLYEQWKREQGN